VHPSHIKALPFKEAKVSSMKRGLRRAGIVGLSTVVASSVMFGFAATAQADWATTGGSIGLVDTQPTVTNTQGSTLVYPGVSGQAMGDIRLALPNAFQNGDTIDLAVFDRTATNDGLGGGSNGQINADAAHKLGFSGTPLVTVNPTSYIPGTAVGPNSGVAGNTENVPVADVAANKGVTPPAFTTSLVASSRAGGLATDIIRLRINAVQATIGTDPTAMWIVTVSGIKADLGAAVSPGELRVVPLAYNGTSAQTSATATGLFSGNLPGTPPAQPIINTYTVPAYVSPVNFTVGAPNNIVADSFTQSVGDITIGETNNYSLQAGTYQVAVGGATIENGVGSNPAATVTATNAATGESVTSPATVVANSLQFDLNQTNVAAANADKVTITLSGLLLMTGTKGPITYTLHGGSIDGSTHAFLVTAGTSAEIPLGFAGVSGVGGVVADSAFAAAGPGVNQTDIEAPALVVSASALPIVGRIGGSNRYDTAAKIAAASGSNNFVVLASGENWPDALSSGYLAHQLSTASILLSAQSFLPAVSADEMRLLGVRTVVIVGGTNAISAGVQAQLEATPQYYPGGLQTIGQGKLQVIRLGGANRYETNRLANEYASAYSGNIVGRTAITFGQASKLTALVATGEGFADALSAGPATRGIGGPYGLPLILTNTAGLVPEASGQLTDLGIEQAVIVGGTAAISSGVATSISGMGVAVDRLAGANRYGTSTAIADFETAPVVPTSTVSGGLGFTGTTAFLSTGLNYADALAGAPLASGSGSPILLTDPTNLSAETQTWLLAHAASYNRVVAFGLAAAVSNAALAAANAAIA
jgi:putative cell wall-binding protein